ncbi:MAG: peptide chain release factor N(5)-glutamine methyltransferase [Thermodesulfovibrionales bacterium]|nr:peptide chain release factor N(5)-glutamine methyltransferase [Thermodesulfovibrionales bacterium]
MNSLKWLREARERLRSSGIRFPEKEAEEILSFIGINPVLLYRDNPELKEDELKKLQEILTRRLKREPLQYILGYAEFLDLRLKTKKGILIPRPETELVALEAIKEAERLSEENIFILDLCTGSGCIAISVAKRIKNSTVYAIDISEKAIELAKENASLNSVENIYFLKGNLFEPIKDIGIFFHIITSNPPYVKSEDISSLEPEVKDWEPIEALDGGEDGLDYYRKILEKAPQYLRPGGWLILELGTGLYKDVLSLAKLYKFHNISALKDLSGIERVLKCQRGGFYEDSYSYR